MLLKETHLQGILARFPLDIAQKIFDVAYKQHLIETKHKPSSYAEEFVLKRMQTTNNSPFNFASTEEGTDFWRKVIIYKDFNEFYERFPTYEHLIHKLIKVFEQY